MIVDDRVSAVLRARAEAADRRWHWHVVRRTPQIATVRSDRDEAWQIYADYMEAQPNTAFAKAHQDSREEISALIEQRFNHEVDLYLDMRDGRIPPDEYGYVAHDYASDMLGELLRLYWGGSPAPPA